MEGEGEKADEKQWGGLEQGGLGHQWPEGMKEPNIQTTESTTDKSQDSNLPTRLKKVPAESAGQRVVGEAPEGT